MLPRFRTNAKIEPIKVKVKAAKPPPQYYVFKLCGRVNKEFSKKLE